MTERASGVAFAGLVAMNLAFFPPALWPHLGVGYSGLHSLLEIIPPSRLREALVSVASVSISLILASIDLMVAMGFGWMGSMLPSRKAAVSVLSGLMGLAHAGVVALIVFLWVQND